MGSASYVTLCNKSNIMGTICNYAIQINTKSATLYRTTISAKAAVMDKQFCK